MHLLLVGWLPHWCSHSAGGKAHVFLRTVSSTIWPEQSSAHPPNWYTDATVYLFIFLKTGLWQRVGDWLCCVAQPELKLLG